MKRTVWPGLNSNDGGRVNSISKAFFVNHRRCNNSTVWFAPGLSGDVDTGFFPKGQVSHKLE
jgi:hypothetical protein